MRYMAVFVLIISVFLLSSFPSPQPSQAQAALSPGCTRVNNAIYDGQYGGGNAGPLDFYAGETVTAAAGDPVFPFGPSPATTYLQVGGGTVDSGGFPNTLTYTFPASANTFVAWGIGEATLVTWTVSCEHTGVRKSSSDGESVDTGGCDVFLDIPDTAVVGAFVQTVVADWAPGLATSPEVTLEAGKTAWVLGVDESGAYYKIYWGCQSLWVPVSAMGPNDDDVWHGTPLPAVVVD
jgi:hypothetical protein